MPLYAKKLSICQDRLGTNIGKTPHKNVFFSQRYVIDAGLSKERCFDQISQVRGKLLEPYVSISNVPPLRVCVCLSRACHGKSSLLIGNSRMQSRSLSYGYVRHCSSSHCRQSSLARPQRSSGRGALDVSGRGSASACTHATGGTIAKCLHKGCLSCNVPRWSGWCCRRLCWSSVRRKRPFCAIVCSNADYLPRQAQDKHRKRLSKRGVFLQERSPSRFCSQPWIHRRPTRCGARWRG